MVEDGITSSGTSTHTMSAGWRRRRSPGVEAVDRGLITRRVRTHAHPHRKARVAKVHGPRAALIPVADDGNRGTVEDGEIGIVVVIDGRHRGTVRRCRCCVRSRSWPCSSATRFATRHRDGHTRSPPPSATTASTTGRSTRSRTRSRTSCAAWASATPDRIVWWGETALDALPIFGAVAKIGAVFAPLNARYGAAEAERVAGYARPRLVIADGSAPRADRRLGRARDRPRHALRARSRRVDEHRSTNPRSTSATRTSSSSPAAAPAARRASCSRTAPTTCGASATPPATTRRAPCACSRCSTWPGWSHGDGRVPVAPPLHFVTTADPHDCSAPSSVTAPPAST